jgi:hypothetical protein
VKAGVRDRIVRIRGRTRCIGSRLHIGLRLRSFAMDRLPRPGEDRRSAQNCTLAVVRRNNAQSHRHGAHGRGERNPVLSLGNGRSAAPLPQDGADGLIQVYAGSADARHIPTAAGWFI